MKVINTKVLVCKTLVIFDDQLDIIVLRQLNYVKLIQLLKLKIINFDGFEQKTSSIAKISSNLRINHNYLIRLE